MATGEIDKELISKDDATDPELRQLMEEVLLLKCSILQRPLQLIFTFLIQRGIAKGEVELLL